MELVPDYAMDGFKIGITVILIFLNGFFVAAEFALVKISKSKLKTMIAKNNMFATTAMWLYKRQNMALSACQLGITMASLALGWIGEPAIAHLITPLIHNFGIESVDIIHGISFTIAFSIITAFHIIIGEQVPKIYAIRKPGIAILGSALILKGFYIILYPFMYVLNAITNVILRWFGIEGGEEHDTALNEEEIRASLSIAHAKGELSKNEHRLLNAVFKFDNEVARQIMKARNEVEILDINNDFMQNINFAKTSKHSRFPLCDGSLDKLIGVIHIKDIFNYDKKNTINLLELARTPLLIPENILIARLLQEFRLAKQHLAFVQDEHGTILGIVTLEDVLEELVGSLQDEFDADEPDIVPIDGKYIVDGDTPLDDLNNKFDINLISNDAHTISGLIVEKFGHRLKVGEKLELNDEVSVEILEVEGIRVTKTCLSITNTIEESLL